MIHRDIRFRVFNISTRRMSGGIEIKPGVVTHFGGDNDDRITQFTGLKDRNGVEVYEGDIVTFSGWNVGNPYPVVFQDGAFRINSYIANYVFREWSGKVIGNMWENPGLLKERG